MKIERTKNAIRNIGFGFIFKIITIICPFIVRTVILYYLGTEYLGLNSLFSSLLSFLSLAELGVGSALVFCMYKPIAEEDNELICALLNLYKKLYRYIGVIILVIGMGMMPFLRFLVKGDCPADINLYLLFSIYLVNTAISYLSFGYKQSLLNAFQRTDIISKRSIVLSLLMYGLQIIAVIITRNYYFYILLLPVFTLLTNIVNSIIVDKMYPQFKCQGTVPEELSKSIRNKIIALFGTKANSVVMHAADNIVISSFIGLSMVGIYGNYYYIMNSIVGIMTTVYSAITAGVGNSLITDSAEKNFHDFKVLSFLNAWIVMIASICLLCLYQPFMKIWVHEERMLSLGVVVLLVIYFYIYQIRRIVLTYKDAAGIWWEDRLRPYVMLIVNIVGNLIMVRIIGIYGVILSTIISMLVSVPWENYTLFSSVFKGKSTSYYISLLKYIFLFIISGVLCLFICSLFNDGIISLFLRLGVCIIVPNSLFVLAFHKCEEFTDSIIKIKNSVKRKKNG